MATDRDLSDAVTRVRAFADEWGEDFGCIAMTHTQELRADDVLALLAHLDALTARCEAAEGDVQRLTTENESLTMYANATDAELADIYGAKRRHRERAARRGEGV